MMIKAADPVARSNGISLFPGRSGGPRLDYRRRSSLPRLSLRLLNGSVRFFNDDSAHCLVGCQTEISVTGRFRHQCNHSDQDELAHLGSPSGWTRSSSAVTTSSLTFRPLAVPKVTGQVLFKSGALAARAAAGTTSSVCGKGKLTQR